MTVFRYMTMIALVGVGLAQSAPAQSSDADHKSSQSEPAAVDEAADKEELIALIHKLQGELPDELERKLIVISLKLATGWCSPHLAVEFEKDLNKLPAKDRDDFEREWKLVREHPLWPRWPEPPSNAPKTEEKPD
jgi:hypothetical protein